MAEAVPKRGHEANVVNDLFPRVAHCAGLPRFNQRQHAVFEDHAPRFAFRHREEVPLALSEHIRRVGKDRRPPPVLPMRVPADMVHVQVRQQDVIDLFRPKAGGPKTLEHRIVEPVEQRAERTRFAVADAGIDDDGEPVGLHHPQMRFQWHAAVGQIKARGGKALVERVARFFVPEREQAFRRQRKIGLVNACDGCRANVMDGGSRFHQHDGSPKVIGRWQRAPAVSQLCKAPR